MLSSKCKHCGVRWTPEEKARRIRLHPECIEPWLKDFQEKQKRKVVAERKAKQRVERAQDRKRREALKRIPDLIAEAQKAFNAYIRERDRQAGYACISSGRPLDWSGNAVDAGHYRSTGAAPHLRFNEDNCHAQSKHDNQYKAGNAVDYRIGLVGRIGIVRVEALEANNRVHKWEREELIAIKATYVQKLKDLKGERDE